MACGTAHRASAFLEKALNFHPTQCAWPWRWVVNPTSEDRTCYFIAKTFPPREVKLWWCIFEEKRKKMTRNCRYAELFLSPIMNGTYEAVAVLNRVRDDSVCSAT